MPYHTPVLLNEAIDALNVIPDQIYIDGTLGNGGHSLEILKRGGIVYGIDQDRKNLEVAITRIQSQGFSDKFFPLHTNFIKIKEIVSNINQPIGGLILDLGLSSNQQIATGRGFSFHDNESLDMRLDPTSQTINAENIINTASFEQLYEIFTKFAQEKYAKPLIIRIISERQKEPIKNGKRLADIIRNYYSQKGLRGHIDPSTKIFMALRIFINHEFENLHFVLNSTLQLNQNCQVAIITFHSGEDRIVKQFIRQHFPNSPKPIKPSFSEIKSNPLSRSAVLRSYRIY